MIMDTPIVKLSDEDLETVYEPAEDSFLLIDALESDLECLKVIKPVVCLEIGSGSGIVITALAMALNKYSQSYYLAIDINPNACKSTKRTGNINLIDINVIQMDLLNNIRNEQTFDIIVFNPPYVLTESKEVTEKRLVFKTWAGGNHGREVMERVFPHIPKLLSNIGMFYLVVIKENDPNYILEMLKRFDMVGTVVKERKVRGEHLYVMRFTKNTSTR
ncbi:methyltransferase N6AMT1 [Vespa crabro]|uniref:methyltransferase N6AMT1 n=1 Tax=Vespa crabro TaxID=7445 RepID=UPI001F005E42|nr:methyltransferase N6AMT1 [Vespa crabro]